MKSWDALARASFFLCLEKIFFKFPIVPNCSKPFQIDLMKIGYIDKKKIVVYSTF